MLIIQLKGKPAAFYEQILYLIALILYLIALKDNVSEIYRVPLEINTCSSVTCIFLRRFEFCYKTFLSSSI